MSILYLTDQGSALRKQGGRFVLLKEDQALASIPQAAVDCVVVFGRVQVSTQAVHELLEDGVPLVYASRSGQFQGILQPGQPKNLFVRLAQYDASLDQPYALELARYFVQAKLRASLTTLDSWKRSGWLRDLGPAQALAGLAKATAAAPSVTDAMALEAQAARLYFDLFGQAIPPLFAWNGRRRQPPPDPVNALLSLTYMMITGAVIRECYACGLDPFIGFLHQHDYGRPSFALDVLEPLRPRYADRFVMRLLQSETFDLAAFVPTENQGCRLAPDGFRAYLKKYEEFVSCSPGSGLPLDQAIPAVLRELVRAIRERRIPDIE